MFATILSSGSYLPANIVSNQDLTQFPKNSLPLIEAKTGVKFRRHAAESECTSDLAYQACARCLGKIGFDPLKIDGIILSTSSPDRLQPATAARVQHLLNARVAFALDVNAVCSGGVYALHLADSLIRSGRHKHILVVAAEIYSRYLNPKDFSTYPYFGDGAGAVLLGAGEQPGILASELGADGSGAELIRVPAGGTMMPFSQMKSPEDRFFKMSGREVFDFAVSKGPAIAQSVLASCKLKASDIRWFISHQANINIVNEIASRLEAPVERFAVNLDKYGNTASASTLIALDELIDGGQMARGDLMVLFAFGGGLTWGACVIGY